MLALQARRFSLALQSHKAKPNSLVKPGLEFDYLSAIGRHPASIDKLARALKDDAKIGFANVDLLSRAALLGYSYPIRKYFAEKNRGSTYVSAIAKSIFNEVPEARLWPQRSLIDISKFLCRNPSARDQFDTTKEHFFETILLERIDELDLSQLSWVVKSAVIYKDVFIERFTKDFDSTAEKGFGFHEFAFTDLLAISGAFDDCIKYSRSQASPHTKFSQVSLLSFVNACELQINTTIIPISQLCRFLGQVYCLRKSKPIIKLMDSVVSNLKGNKSNSDWVDAYQLNIARLYKYIQAYSPKYDTDLKEILKAINHKLIATDISLKKYKKTHTSRFIFETVKAQARFKLAEVLYLDVFVKRINQLSRRGFIFKSADIMDLVVSLAELSYKDRFSGRIAFTKANQNNLNALLILFDNELHSIKNAKSRPPPTESFTDSDEEVNEIGGEKVPSDHTLAYLWALAVFNHMSPSVRALLHAKEFLSHGKTEADYRRMIVVAIWIKLERAKLSYISKKVFKTLMAYKYNKRKKARLTNEKVSDSILSLSYASLPQGYTMKLNYLEFPFVINIAYINGKDKIGYHVLKPKDFIVKDHLLTVNAYLAFRQLKSLGWEMKILAAAPTAVQLSK